MIRQWLAPASVNQDFSEQTAPQPHALMVAVATATATPTKLPACVTQATPETCAQIATANITVPIMAYVSGATRQA